MIGALVLFIFIAMAIVAVYIMMQKDLTQAVILFMGFGLGSSCFVFPFCSS